jgi:phosphoserine phosphatase RsbU/P
MISAADLLNAMLGTLFLTLGLAATAASAFRTARRDRTLLWFGVFTALYGARLIGRSHAVHEALPFAMDTWQIERDVITYVILVPGVLLTASVLDAEWRRVLKALWITDAVAAAGCIAWDSAVGRSGAAMGANRVVVVANLVAALALVGLDMRRRRWTRDGWVVLSGALVFGAVAAYETIRGGMFGRIDAEPFAMLVFVFCLGCVVLRHVFQSERRIAVVGQELATARRIQQSILPRHSPVVPGLSIATHYDAMAEVAGDFFDFVVTPSGQLGVLVADVSGHGVPAALIASMVKIALAVQENEIHDPGVVLTRMNRALCGRFELAYVTATFALIDPAAGRLSYAVAGHPSPLLIRAGGRLESLDQRGLVLGFLPDASYSSSVVPGLARGDRLVFYTDGITEAARADGEFFGDRQFQRVLAGSEKESADRFVPALVDAARRWSGADFADDVTLVVVDMARTEPIGDGQ